jgi:hypothetical protein
MATGGIPLGEWSGSDATDRLRESVDAANLATDRNTKTIIRLTWAIATMTLFLVVGLVVQIWLAVK